MVMEFVVEVMLPMEGKMAAEELVPSDAALSLDGYLEYSGWRFAVGDGGE